ncbi:MAG: hypothetical protein GF353_19210 [Candidatus Lokiarchaeota archaeon]|nr:hypothetical protein [Candidatus Lokiarchaeota archaeon]
MDNYIKLLNKVSIILLTFVSLSIAQSPIKTTKEPLLALHVDENSIIPVPEAKYDSVESYIWLHFKLKKNNNLENKGTVKKIFKNDANPSITFLNNKYGITHSLNCEFSIVTATSIDTLYSIAMEFKYIKKNVTDSTKVFTKGNFQKLYPSKIDSCLGIIDEYFKNPFYCSPKFWKIGGCVVCGIGAIVWLIDIIDSNGKSSEEEKILDGVPDFPEVP